MSMEWKKKQKILGKYDVDKLKNKETLRTYQETVTNLLGRREGFDKEQIKESWKAIKTSITESAGKKVIRERMKPESKHTNSPTLENIRDFENRRRENSRKERLEDIENLKHNPREFFKRCKTFKNGFVPVIRMIEDNNSTFITKPENIAEEFRSYFEKILNRDSTTGVDEQDDTIYYTAEPEVPNPSLEEIQYAIQTLKNNKAPGDDKIAAELLMLERKNLIKNLHNLIQQIWTKEKIPKDWNESLINEIMGNYQSGFRKNKSTTDHIFVIRQIMEKSYEFPKNLRMVFIDYKQAYDSIDREGL
ncbi:hypothetical protein QTP88_010591 [Uroleucon formosanum]